jgi:hypothetical protein
MSNYLLVEKKKSIFYIDYNALSIFSAIGIAPIQTQKRLCCIKYTSIGGKQTQKRLCCIKYTSLGGNQTRKL